MAKNIQLSDEVYARLETFRVKRETFSDAVNRLLTLLSKIEEFRDILVGVIAFGDYKKEQIEKQTHTQ